MVIVKSDSVIKKIISNKSKTITGAAILLGAASFVSRIVGLVRDRIFAHQFGAGEILDVYYAAFKIPDVIYNFIILGALSAGLIPIFTSYYNKNKQDAFILINKLIYVLSLVILPISLIIYIFLPELVAYMVPGFTQSQQELTLSLSRVLLLSPIILGLSGIVGGVLQSLKQFAIYSLTPIVYNLGIIIGALIFYPMFGAIGLAYGVILGAFLHLFIQLPSLFKSGFRLGTPTKLLHPGVKEIATLMIPRMLALGANQFMLLAIIFFASTLGTGNITVFQFANNLQFFPVGIIGISFAVAAFPTLSERSAKNDVAGLARYVSQTTRQIIFAIIPFTVLLILLRAQIIRVVYGTGSFDWNATILTANTLAFFSFSLFAQSIVPLLTRAFYAIKDTITPLVSGVIAATITVATMWQFSDIFGVAGLALSFSLGSIVQLAFLWVSLRRQVGSLYEENILILILKISVGTLLMGITTQSLKLPIANLVDMTTFIGIFIQASIAGLTGLLLYVLSGYLLKIPEITILQKSIKNKFLKTKSLEGEITSPDLT